MFGGLKAGISEACSAWVSLRITWSALTLTPENSSSAVGTDAATQSGALRFIWFSPQKSDVVPFVSARLPGAGNVLFRLDSGNGSSASMVTEVFAKATDQAAIAEGFAATAAGIQPVKSGRLSNFTLGGIDHPDLVVDEEQIFNVIGLGILSRHVVTFDFPGMKMYLQKGQSFARRDELDMSGLRLWRIGDRITVHSVDDGSPASTAGLKPEDVVLRIGNLSAAAVWFSTTCATFSSPAMARKSR